MNISLLPRLTAYVYTATVLLCALASPVSSQVDVEPAEPEVAGRGFFDQ
jgi:hypothetical protein